MVWLDKITVTFTMLFEDWTEEPVHQKLLAFIAGVSKDTFIKGYLEQVCVCV